MNLTRELKLSRTAYIISADIGADANTVEISFSSEQPVLRDFGYEVLEHSTRAINSERIDGGLPVLWNHNRDNQIGRAEGIYLDSTSKKLRAVVRFSKRQAAQEILQDIRDGIIKDVSFGYCIDDWESTRSASPGEPDTVVATRWTPFETSFVSIPADITVGVGRSMDIPKEEIKEEAKTEEQTETLETPTPEVAEITEEVVAAENEVVENEVNKDEQRSTETIKTESIISNIQTNLREVPILKGNEYMTSNRQETIALMGVAEKLGVAQEARELLASERSIEEIRTELMNLAASKQTSTASAPVIDARELKGYSITRALEAKISGDWTKAGLEREASTFLAQKLGRDAKGFYVPTNSIRAANTMNTAGVGQGKELVYNEYAGFIDMLRPQCKVLSLGAQVISGLTNNYSFTQESSAPSVYYVGENPGTGVTDTKMGTAQKTLSPKQMMCAMSYTRNQYVQSVEAIDALLISKIVRETAIALDQAAIGWKTQMSNAPTGGILMDGGVPVTSLGTNGAGITVAASTTAVFDLKTVVNKNYALTDNCAYLTTPDMQGKLEKIAIPGVTAIAQASWANGKLNGYRAESTGNVPSNLDKGTATNQCHAIIFGDFSQLVIGEFGVLDISVDPYTLLDQGSVRIVSNYLFDVGILRPTAFAIIKDALNS